MPLIISMIPVYFLANLHCLGMCGPLVMMIGRHPHRYFYFFGRLFSFGLIGAIAGGAGALVQLWLQQYHLPALMSLSFGFLFILMGFGVKLGLPQWVGYRLAGVSNTLSLLALKEERTPIFLFGFFTAFLPCGQSLMIFSVSAISGFTWLGGVNGFLFALCTSPALWGAMQFQQYLMRFKQYYPQAMAFCAFFVGTLAICRGLAEIGVIPHLSYSHFVVF